MNGVVSDLKFRPKHMIITAISNHNADRSFAEALADHRNTKIATDHYIGSAIELNSINLK